MEEELNYREELEKARKAAAGIELHGHEDEIDAYWEVVCGTVLLAEHDLHEQENEWEIASLAEEMLRYAEPLEGYDHMINKLYSAVKRMADALSEHPRLMVRLLKFEKLVLRRIEAMEQHELTITEDVIEEIERLERNIKLADEGKLTEIPQSGGLKHDPIEWTARWEEIIDEADRKVYDNLADTPRGMGFCHAFWHERATVLRKDYQLEWRSPSVMNPRVMFD